MRIHRLYIALGLLIAFGVFFELTAHADENNEFTKVAFNAPVQIPGRTLAPGTYVFEQGAPDDDPDIVQVFSADHGVLLATLFTVPAERAETMDDTSITLAEAAGVKPDVLVKWFYPGRLTGHEFVYPKEQAQEIAHAKLDTFVGNQLIPGSVVAGE